MLGSKSIHNRLTAWFMRQTTKSGVRRVAALSAALASDVGLVRDENQDRVAMARGQDFSGHSFVLVALSDGIGGLKNGAECAAMTLGSFFGAFFEEVQQKKLPEIWLSNAAHESNNLVHAKFGGNGGATLVAILISKDGAIHWLSIGDSRVYYSDGIKLTQLSVDDTIAGQLGKQQNLDIGQSNLLQFIGMGNQLEPHISQLDSSLNGTVLLTSDGVHFLNSVWLGQIIGHSSDPGVCVRRLTEMAKWCGGFDNASVAMISLDFQIMNCKYPQEIGYDIWDPYGELQIIADIVSDNNSMSVKPSDQAAKPSKNLGPPKTPNNESGKRNLTATKQKRKRTETTKKPKDDSPKLEGKSDEGKITKEKPQLFIEFSYKKLLIYFSKHINNNEKYQNRSIKWRIIYI